MVYVVTVGCSDRDRRAYDWVRRYACENGLTFMRWGEGIDYYLELERERVFPSADMVFSRFRMVTVSVLQLRTVARTVGFAFYERSVCFPRTFFQKMKALKPSVFLKLNQAKRAKVSHREQRKNLSHAFTTHCDDARA